MRNLITLLLAATIVLSSAPAHGDIGDQLFKLLPKDGAEFDSFGFSVAISGTSAIVGASQDNENGFVFGSAYLFDTSTGQQIFKLLPNDLQAGDEFGVSVAISGIPGKKIAIVGSFRDDDHGNSSGSAYLFDVTTGTQLAKLLPNDGAADDSFGVSVAISGNIAIIGAMGDNDNGSSSGSAYLFNISDPANPTQVFKLLADDGAASDRFGGSVAISGTIAIVAAKLDDDFGSESGSAYLFDTTTGQQQFKLLPDDGAKGDFFGNSVAIDGTTAIIGASLDDSGTGSAYIFDTTTGQQVFKLLPDDGAVADFFGISVAISGPLGKQIAIVGANFDDDNGEQSGSAYLFDVNTGNQIAKLLPNDGAADEWFGWFVALSGSTAIVGAVRDDDNGILSGSAYLFDAAVNTCPWDLDNSGSVGTSDLLELFAQWGTAGAADFDGSGAVGTNDLLILFANWGLCK